MTLSSITLTSPPIKKFKFSDYEDVKTTFGGFDTILHHYEEYILVHKRNYFEIHVSGQILCDPSLNMFSKCLRLAIFAQSQTLMT